MSKVINGSVLFNESPKDYPVLGLTTVYREDEFDLDVSLSDGETLVKVLFVGVDPYLRHCMAPAHTLDDYYIVPFELGQPRPHMTSPIMCSISCNGVGCILRSKNDKFKPGDHITGIFSFQTYETLTDAELSTFCLIENPLKLPLSVFLSAAGMPGHTAYVGWRRFANAKSGQTVYVSTAAGAVGSVVVQLAKAQGLKVIGSAGSDEKVAYLLNELKLHFAFNYKTSDTLTALREAAPGGIDIYWDNVGGPQLEAALSAGRNHMRVIACGAMHCYNGQEYHHVKNLGLVVLKRVQMYGLMYADFPDLIEEAKQYLPGAIARGEIRYQEHVYKGLREAGQAIVDVQRGQNIGKAVIAL